MFSRMKIASLLTLLAAVAVATSTTSAQNAAPADSHAGHAHNAEPTPSAPRTDGKAPKLRIDKAEFPFGEVWKGEEVIADFTLHNDGDAPLELKNVKPTCGCTAAEEFDKIIEPGKSVVLKFKLNTSKKSGHTTSTISVWSDDLTAAQPTKLSIVGDVKPQIEISPQEGARWERITPDATELVKTVTFTNHTEDTVTLTPVPNPRKSIFTYEIKEIEPNKKWEMVITANRPFEPRMNSTYFRFNTGLEKFPELRVNAQLYSLPWVEVQPAFMTLPVPIKEGGWNHPNVRVKCNAAKEMKITSITSSHPEITHKVTTIKDGNEYRLEVDIKEGFDPPANEPVKLIIKTNLEESPEVFVNFRANKRTPPAGKASVGSRALPIKLPTIDNKQVTLGAVDGEITVIDFWLTTCRFCAIQLPIVEQLSKEYADKDVRFVTVNTDTKRSTEQVADFVKNIGMTMTVALDPKGLATRAYDVKGTPRLIVVGKDGVIQAIHAGAKTTLKQDLTLQLNSLLAGVTRGGFPSSDNPLAASNVKPDATKQSEFVELQPELPAALTFAEKKITIGEFKPATTGSYKIDFRNSGGAPLTLKSVTGTNGLKITEGYEKVLQPGKAGSVEVTFDTPSEVKMLSFTVTFESDDPANPKQMIELMGSVKEWVELQPFEGVDFGRRVPTFSMPRMASLIWNGEGEVKYLKIESTSKTFTAEIKLIKNGPHAMVNVMAHKPFEPGDNHAIITITTDCKQQPTVTIPVQLFMPPRIELVPEVVELVKQSRLQKVSVLIKHNTGDVTNALHILGIEKSNRRIRTQFYPEPDGLSYKLEMTFLKNFTCAPEGEKITIRTDDPENGEIVIPIKMSTK